jgi:hypothetical protein
MSAGLPDCRAYELVTPEDLGRSQDMLFTAETDEAISSSDGEHLALRAATPLEPNPSVNGTFAVFSRTGGGWTMKSVVAPGAGNERLHLRLFSPDLSQIVFESEVSLNLEESISSAKNYEVGPVGGQYSVMVRIPATAAGASPLLGANAGTPTVPAFSDVLFNSTDHGLLPQASPERGIAEKTLTGAPDLYDWTRGRLRLINTEGESVRCGAVLGAGAVSIGSGAKGAVSADGSKIFFTTPASGTGCNEPSRLYMSIDGIKTVEVSDPAPGVEVQPSERQAVRYNAATPDGSKVFFNTTTPLTMDETPVERSENKLYMYNTITGALALVKSNIKASEGTEGRQIVVSEDGSTLYYDAGENIYRYNTENGETSFVARITTPKFEGEPSYTTPNGEFLVFVSGESAPVEVVGSHPSELEPERRGAGHNELYRYDSRDGSVICVSCGDGLAPALGNMREPQQEPGSVLATQDGSPPFIQMSEDGREVFFQTSAQLVPQDVNSNVEVVSTRDNTPGMDVYEWEADGTGGCLLPQGCTHLISSGESVGPSFLLGASQDGKNVFLSSASQLLPQATPEFSNIYDARVNGGFPLSAKTSECTSCQGGGSQPPLFSPGASLTFEGAGDPSVPHPSHPIVCAKRRRLTKSGRLSHGRCVKARRMRRVKRMGATHGAGSRRRGR